MSQRKRESVPKKIRVTLDLSERDYRMLEQAREDLRVDTNADVLRRSLRCVKILADKIRNDKKLDNLAFLDLEHLRPKKKPA